MRESFKGKGTDDTVGGISSSRVGVVREVRG